MSYRHALLKEEKVFRDPVHRYIHVRLRVIWDLIATREFQRLRRIKQLGTSYLTFHGAEHSRFNHSLGVYELVRRITESFSGKKGWDQDQQLLALVASLLHDIGHGPFSHSFEKVFALDHEQFTVKMICGDTEVNKVLMNVSKTFPEEVASVIKKTHKDQLVTSLISSQIDADRMDYLLRDAYFTGVSYGQFDLERLLRVMRPHDNQVVIKQTGLHAVEDYLLSRYQMHWQVYFHPVSRSAEVILSRILHRVKILHREGYHFKQTPAHFLSFFTGDVSLDAYIRLDESIVMFYFQQWQNEDDHILVDLCDRFLNRRLFKFVSSSAYNCRDKETIRAAFTTVGIDPDYYLIENSTSDLPYTLDHFETKEKPVSIYLLTKDETLQELSSLSPVVQSISQKELSDRKLFYPRDLIEQLPDSKEKEMILNVLK